MDQYLAAIVLLIFNLILFIFLYIFPEFFNPWILGTWIALSLAYVFWALIKNDL